MTLTAEDKAKRKAAYVAMRKALRRGDIVRGSACEGCQPLHGHHRFGYDRPLDVVWLCSFHHTQEHAEWRSGRLAAEAAFPKPQFDQTWITYHEFVIATAERQIKESKAQLAVLRARVTRHKNIEARKRTA